MTAESIRNGEKRGTCTSFLTCPHCNSDKVRFVSSRFLWQNGFAESFIGTFRSECLDPEIFFNLTDAQLKISLWVKFYNEDRPHSSLNYLQPRTYKKKWDELLWEKEEIVI